jgi:hypothetical protein
VGRMERGPVGGAILVFPCMDIGKPRTASVMQRFEPETCRIRRKSAVYWIDILSVKLVALVKVHRLSGLFPS